MNDNITTTQAPSRLLSEREAAARLNVKPATMRVWRSAGKGPPYTKAGGVRYPEHELDSYIERNTIRPGT